MDTKVHPSPPGPLSRIGLTLEGLRVELSGSWRLAASSRSFLQLASDAIGYRADHLPWVPAYGQPRSVGLKDGTRLTYRPNRGDVRAIAETWMARAYEFPLEPPARNILDLGAHIGAAGVWLMRRYGGSRLVAVEPVPGNAELARLNFERNELNAEVLTAAVATTQGTGYFEVQPNSTLGSLGRSGIEVSLVTPQALIDRFPADERIDLVKMDVEGAERELFAADLAWLGRVDCLVMEMHVNTDFAHIIRTVTQLGFSYTEIARKNKYKGLADRMVAFRRLLSEPRLRL